MVDRFPGLGIYEVGVGLYTEHLAAMLLRNVCCMKPTSS